MCFITRKFSPRNKILKTSKNQKGLLGYNRAKVQGSEMDKRRQSWESHTFLFAQKQDIVIYNYNVTLSPQ